MWVGLCAAPCLWVCTSSAMWAWLWVGHAYINVYDTAHIGVLKLYVEASLVPVGTCALVDTVHRWVSVQHVCWCGRLGVHKCVLLASTVVHKSSCAHEQVPECMCTSSAYVPVCTHRLGTPRDIALDTQLCASGCCPTWKNRHVCIYVFVCVCHYLALLARVAPGCLCKLCSCKEKKFSSTYKFVKKFM